tara:strand:+ start:342 stop:677 length:336 start_codon:yes stop_codon:yes gene_type:complete
MEQKDPLAIFVPVLENRYFGLLLDLSTRGRVGSQVTSLLLLDLNLLKKQTAESTPLIGYFFGLFLAQAALLLLVTAVSHGIINWLGGNGLLLTAGVWIGIGSAFSWVPLVD